MHIVTFANISVRIYERQTSKAVGRCGFLAAPTNRSLGRCGFQPHRSGIETQWCCLRLLTLARKECLNEIRAREVS